MATYDLAQLISLHVAVEFVVEPFRPSGPSLRTMKISAQLCCVDTSYFTHNWETRGGRERRIPSRTGPKDLPTGPSVTLKKWNLQYYDIKVDLKQLNITSPTDNNGINNID